MRKHIRLLLPAALLLVAPMLHAETVEGILMDKMCSGMVAEKGFGAAKMHTKECALMPNCVASGYGVVTAEGKFFKFDASGDQKATEELKATSKKNNITVTVDGKVSGDTVAAQSFKIT